MHVCYKCGGKGGMSGVRCEKHGKIELDRRVNWLCVCQDCEEEQRRELARLRAEVEKWRAPLTDPSLKAMRDQLKQGGTAPLVAYINALEHALAHKSAEVERQHAALVEYIGPDWDIDASPQTLWDQRKADADTIKRLSAALQEIAEDATSYEDAWAGYAARRALDAQADSEGRDNVV